MFAMENLRVASYAPHGAMAAHSHDEASLGVILAGDFVERVANSERRYGGGYVTFAPAGVTHSQRFGALGARQIIVRPQAAWLAYLCECRVNLADSPYVRAPVFLQLGQKLLDELNHDDDFSPVASEGVMLEIVAAFGRADRLAAGSSPPPWLARTRDFLHAHAADSPSMKEIAHAAGRHEIHLAREFRRHFGMSVGSYLRKLRTERAAHLLQHTRSNITDVALDCGFASHSHLCRVFKAHFGISPSRYRAQN